MSRIPDPPSEFEAEGIPDPGEELDAKRITGDAQEGEPVPGGMGDRGGCGPCGLVVGDRGADFGQGGVPVGFQGVGDEPVGGVDGQVAAAGQVGVVAGALDGGGA